MGIEYVQQKNNRSLILFVHGFTGSKDTWKNSKDEYLHEMLMKNEDIANNFDFAYFNYYTKFLEFFDSNISSIVLNKLFYKTTKKARKNLSISDLSDNMGSIVKVSCGQYENIIIIAHSMGGLISKSFIINQLKELEYSNVKLFISLAVPHAGSNLANLAQLIGNKNIQINDLAPLNEATTTLSRDWINMEHPKTIYLVGQYDEIVVKNSGIAFDKGKQTIIYCDDDHISICKPESENELVFASIRKYLLDFLNEDKLSKNMTAKKFNDDGSYDEELFVFKLIIADIDKSLINGAKQNFFNAEYITRMLNKDQLDCLEELYIKIKHLYLIYYGKFLSNDIKNSTGLITSIHEKIREDNKLDISNEEFKKIFSKLNYMHKTGMLHQLANEEDGDIFWKKDCEDDVKNFIKGKKAND